MIIIIIISAIYLLRGSETLMGS